MIAVVKIISYDQYDFGLDQSDLVIIGPGPGNPNDQNQPKMLKLLQICQLLLKAQKPLFCICLGHQILCKELGFKVLQKKIPLQGVQKLVTLWGKKEYVGFYNAFAAHYKSNDHDLEIEYEADTNEIYALRGSNYMSVQFHPESILTTNGFAIIDNILNRLLLGRTT
jgi:phenazine biosynthesis protein phzE